MIWYNTDLNIFEGFQGNEWGVLSPASDELARTLSFMGA
jgi:hypothetical protein